MRARLRLARLLASEALMIEPPSRDDDDDDDDDDNDVYVCTV